MAVKKKKLNLPTIWMTVYGDFITNETLFFMLLFGSILVALQYGFNKEQLKDFMQDISPTASQQQKKEVRTVQETKEKLAGIEGVSGVRLGDRELRVIVPESVLFDAGSAKLKDSARETLLGVGKVLASAPYAVVVEGHTCDLPLRRTAPAGMERWQIALARSTGDGPYGSNRELSGARALQVVRFLTREKVLPPERLAASACGPSEPLVPNTSEENRRQNRRIEIKILLNNNTHEKKAA